MTISQERKAKTRAGKIFLLSKESKIIENDKKTIFIKGETANDATTRILKDLYSLKKQDGKYFGKKNPIRPFENSVPLEFICDKNDTSMFVFGSHSKKRPNNIVIGRMFDKHLLDIYEFGINNYKGINQFSVPKVTQGIKPILSFNGLRFESDPKMKRLKNLLIGPKVEQIAVNGLEHVLSFTCEELNDVVYFRSYRIDTQHKASTGPCELTEIGPRMDMHLRRFNIASDDLFKKALKIPKQLKAKKIKNISYDEEGTRFARIHIKQQNLSALRSRKIKGLHKQAPGSSDGLTEAGTNRGPFPPIFKKNIEKINKLCEKMEV